MAVLSAEKALSPTVHGHPGVGLLPEAIRLVVMT